MNTREDKAIRRKLLEGVIGTSVVVTFYGGVYDKGEKIYGTLIDVKDKQVVIRGRDTTYSIEGESIISIRYLITNDNLLITAYKGE